MSLLFVVITAAVSAAALRDSLQKGKDYYFAGEFKSAISQFQLMAQGNPNDPEPYLWLGKSYALMADLKPPLLSTQARLKARMYLNRAVQLAPGCEECRRELFDLLVSSDDSPSALREAKLLVERTPESDPDYASMQSSLMQARMQSSSPEYLTTAVLSIPSQTLARLSLRRAPLPNEQRWLEMSRKH